MSIKSIRTEGTAFITADGSRFTARGINMVCKDKSLNYTGNYTPEDFRFLKQHGFNLIRLGIFWDGAEPAPGVYDSGYLKKIDSIIEMAAAEGIPVFLDMHQDLYGIVFEDGAPEWATITDGCEHIRTGLWSESYLISPAVQHAFDNFWKNTPASDGTGIRSHYVNLWKHLAGHFAANPNVIGYDIMNEPFPGTPGAMVAEILGELSGSEGMPSFDDPETIAGIISRIAPVTTAFEEEYLNPFYDEVAGAIRSADNDTLIMFESNYFANAGIPSAVRAAVYPNGRQIPGQVYVPHGYDIMVDTDAYDEGGTERVAFIFASLMETAKRLSLPVMIGEWGCYPDATPAQKAQARFLLNTFGNYGIGNVYYDFSHIRDGKILEVLSSDVTC